MLIRWRRHLQQMCHLLQFWEDPQLHNLSMQVHTDADLSTKFDWKRPHMLSSLSASTIIWRIPEGTPSGTYRIQHFGNHKHLTGDILPYSGVSREFQVAASPAERERARSQLGMMSSIWRWSNQALVLL